MTKKYKKQQKKKNPKKKSFFSQNLKSSCFHISLWNFEKQEIVQTTIGG
jgi:hypothetical protein